MPDFCSKVAFLAAHLGIIMQSLILGQAILDSVQMCYALAGLSDRRGEIARILKSGELISLRRGLYATRRDLDSHCALSIESKGAQVPTRVFNVSILDFVELRSISSESSPRVGGAKQAIGIGRVGRDGITSRKTIKGMQ